MNLDYAVADAEFQVLVPCVILQMWDRQSTQRKEDQKGLEATVGISETTERAEKAVFILADKNC